MDINDLKIGDVIWKIQSHATDCYVSGINTATNEVTVDYKGTSHTHDCAEWARRGYTKYDPALLAAINQAAASYGGIMSWLPNTPQPQILPNAGSWTFYNPGEVTKPAKTRRQVSHNGKDWVDYRHLLDADDFELYAHRREV